MASINGVQIKSLKSFKGHEGETCYQGTIYIDGVKQGLWSQDSWGGSDSFDFDLTELRKRFSGVFNEPFDCTGLFIARVVTLANMEKAYKREVKKGYRLAIFCVAWDYMSYYASYFANRCEDEFVEYHSLCDTLKKDLRLSDEYAQSSSVSMVMAYNLRDFDIKM